MSNFSKQLKQLRLEHGLTQVALAKELDVTQNAIFNWENEKREPNLDMIRKIAEYFNTSLVYLLDGKEEFKTPPKFIAYDKKGNKIEIKGEKSPKFTTHGTTYAPQEAYELLHSLIDEEGIDNRKREEVSRQLKKILNSFKGLNEIGRQKAVERIEELYMIPKYIFDNFPDTSD